jgi:hypothetical protein
MEMRSAAVHSSLSTLLLLCLAGPAFAQTPGDTLRRAAGPQYEAGSRARALVGSNWRDVWTTPVRVTVLDLATFAGGLTPVRRGGGNQSITLHMRDAQGAPWIFRSIDKDPTGALPDELGRAPAGDIVRDHISALHPGGHFMLPPLLAAVGVLHVRPQLFVMPNDPRLGEFRGTFAGMLGELEPRAEEGPDNTEGFAGSRSVKGSEGFLDDLEDSQAHRLDEREFLRARLVDFVVGDPDRGTDQWRWARFGEEGAYTWRPVPIDRDWAFVRADGRLAGAARGFYPKITRFGPRYPSINTLTYSSHVLDRRLLTRLTRLDIATEAERVRAALTDEVIDHAVAALPPEWAALSATEIAAALRARRDRLPRIAAEFYEWLATDVDVRGTDERDFVEIERRPGGSVLVRIRPLQQVIPVAAAADSAVVADTAAATALARARHRNGDVAPESGSEARRDGLPDRPTPFYERMFRPDETREVRVYLHGGDDHVRITGEADGPIVVRVIGGGGDDVLEDLAGGVRFYDDRGDNRIVRSRGTRFRRMSWSAPDPPEGVRANASWAPDWGGGSSLGPAIGYGDRSGVLLGVESNHVRYGFRRMPHRWKLAVRGLYAPATGGASAELDFDLRLQDPGRSVRVEAHASSIDAFRFYGFGNDTPPIESSSARIAYHDFRIAPALRWHFGPRPGSETDAGSAEAEDADEEEGVTPDVRWSLRSSRTIEGTFQLGPVFAWTDPRLPANAAVVDAELAEAAVTQLGMRAVLDLSRTDRPDVPRRGFRIRADAAGYPLTGGPAGAFGSVGAQVMTYVPLIGDGPHLALRAGGRHAFGEYPLFEASFIGGRRTLRGMRTARFAGDDAVHAAAELRLPLDTITLLVRTEAGLFAFTDAGRVWYDGASPGGWHTGYGGGIWLAVLGRAVSLAMARGESTRVYAWLGLPY